jgi:hypothetical protein
MVLSRSDGQCSLALGQLCLIENRFQTNVYCVTCGVLADAGEESGVKYQSVRKRMHKDDIPVMALKRLHSQFRMHNWSWWPSM